MPKALTPFKKLDTKNQAAYFYARERTGSKRDPTKRMFETGRFHAPIAQINTDQNFPVRNTPITFKTEILITGANPNGLLFEFGNAALGVKLAVSATDVGVCAGSGNGSDNLGVGGVASLPLLSSFGAQVELVLAINPGAGKARLFANGELILRLDTNDDTALVGGFWANGDFGSVGASFGGASANNRALPSVTGAPVNFQLVQPLRAYFDQLPRQFDA